LIETLIPAAELQTENRYADIFSWLEAASVPSHFLVSVLASTVREKYIQSIGPIIGCVDLDTAGLRKALSADNGPGVVSVKDLKNKQQSPVYLREEIVRRINADAELEGKQQEKPLHVIVLVGSSTDFYTFPKLPDIETGEKQDCVIYYLQFEFSQREGITGAASNVEKS
jgi:hypothetical protein